MEWFQIKLFLEHAARLDMATLHVLVGIPVQFAVAFVFRVPVTRWTPWLCVMGLAVVNEWSDLRVEEWPDAGMQYGEGAKDIWLTMLLPTLLLAVARYKPRLLVGEADRPGSSGDTEGGAF